MVRGAMMELLHSVCKEYKPVGLRQKNEESKIYGFVAEIGEELVLFAEQYDFIPNGFRIFAIDQIAAIETESDFRQNMILCERLYEHFGAFPQVRLDSLQHLFEDLMVQGEMLAVELADDGSYYPGKIEKVTARTVWIRPFDANGIWEKEPLRLYYGQIGSVRMGDHYLETYCKYIPSVPENFGKIRHSSRILALAE